ncbi:helix-turn-helix domain-containing protein [Bacillus sp. FJAT-50079]|nr:helix-turn-helix domain-containing protein [Bacillus sp. FJAT-50079]
MKYKKENWKEHKRKEQKIRNLLRELRKAKNLTTQELADKVNVSQSYIRCFA